MKYLSTIVVLISAYTLINGKSTGADLIDSIDQILQRGNQVGSRQKGPDLTPVKIEDDGCACLSPSLCNNKLPIKEIPVRMRMNDVTCANGLVRCCEDGVYSSTKTPESSTPNLTPVKNPTSSCPCILSYQCENGIPCKDGCDAIDAKINDVTCSEPGYVRCCNEVNTSTVTPPTITTQKRPVLDPVGHNPTLSCPCLSYYQCQNGIPCTDGCDAIDAKINDGACSEPGFVPCCNGVNNSTTVATPTSTTQEKPNLDPVGHNPTLSCPCLPHYQCENGIPCTDGCDAIDAKINDDTCPDPTYVRCCNGVNTTATPPVSGNTPDITRNNQPTVSSPINNSKPTPTSSGAPYRRRCGVRNPNGIGFRIIDTSAKNNLAYFGEFPWMVAVLWEDKDTSDTQEYYPEQTLLKYQCGGSLIHPQVVLTSTHCVVSKEKIFHVRAGEWDIKSTTEQYPHQDRLVEKVITHPEFYSGGLYNDIALLILETPVNITRNVDTVCLPAQGEILEDTRCYTSGWGRNVFEMNGQYETTLKKVDLPIVRKDLCQTQYRTTRSQNDFILHDSFVCAGGEEGKDACEGDGGSPLACPFLSNPKRYFQAGIVSWGIGCGLKDVPGLYANVARFRNWIDEHMIKLGYDTSYYTY